MNSAAERPQNAICQKLYDVPTWKQTAAHHQTNQKSICGRGLGVVTDHSRVGLKIEIEKKRYFELKTICVVGRVVGYPRTATGHIVHPRATDELEAGLRGRSVVPVLNKKKSMTGNIPSSESDDGGRTVVGHQENQKPWPSTLRHGGAGRNSISGKFRLTIFAKDKRLLRKKDPREGGSKPL